MRSLGRFLPSRQTDNHTSDNAALRWLQGSWWNRIPIGEMFGADLRSLTLFRMVLGFVILLDLAGRASNLRAHYTDAGVLPRGTVLSSLNEWRWSILLANGTLTFQAILFFLTAVAAILLIIGLHTRLMTFIIWVMVISIQVRNPLLSSGADTLMRLLLFWAMFLPLGARWSLDSQTIAHTDPAKPTRVLSFGTAGLFLQIAFMYWFTALLKTGSAWVSEGTALYYALAAGHVARPYSDSLLQFPMLLRGLTHATLLLEFIGPVLLFTPFFRGPVRTLAIASLMSLHIGIFLTLDVGLFPVAGALCMVSFLPTWFWDVLLPRLQTALPRPPEPLKQVRTKAAQLTTQVLFPPAPSPATTVSDTPQVMGADHNDLTPDVSDEAARVPFKSVSKSHTGNMTGSRLANILAAFCLVFILLWNISTVSAFKMPRASYPVAYGLAIYQKWNMFAPRPPSITQWYVVRGVLENGQEVDLFEPIVSNNSERVIFFSWDQLQDIDGTYFGDKYWRKYFAAIGKSGRATERLRFAAYACRTWNNHYGGDARLDRVEIFRLTQRTLLSGEEAEINRTLLDDFGCV